MSERTSGWSPIEHVVTQGDGAEPLAAALSCEGREDRWTHGFHTYPAGPPPDAARAQPGAGPEGARRVSRSLPFGRGAAQKVVRGR